MTDKPKHTNALIDSESPYLRQHAHNPVNWFPWSENVWENAAREDKLVLVSIGYSTCHWCHVMERECFEDEPTAALMNAHFLNMKVDREERPDVDMVYMDACQLMTGRGGWPLNVICMPDKRPIFAGTYYPKDSWQNILQQLSDLWKTDREKMRDYAQKIQDGLVKMNLLEFPAKQKFTRADLQKTAENMIQSFDLQYGGLDRSQKFPMPVVYEYLLDEYLVSGNKHLLDFVNFTLIKMANGGIYDHIRGGFYRYATDRLWFAPHFEKMLYDNAQLISLYSRAYNITSADLYKNIALQTLDFAERELCMEHGGYYSALDADSEGVEGRFYVFTFAEMQSALNPEELHLARVLYGIKETGNWEHSFNILHKPLSPLQVLEELKIDVHSYQKMHISINQKLYALQESRIRPGLDDKIICSWNGLMLKALADAGKYLDEFALIARAQNLGEWLWDNLWIENKLLRFYSKKGTVVPGFSEDYACMISGFIALFEADGNALWLQRATLLCEKVYRDFFDAEKQIFVFTPLEEAALLLHKTDTSDDVIPSTNSMLAIAFQKVGILMDRNDWVETGKILLQNLRHQVLENPPWYSNWGRAAQMEGIGLLQIFASGDLAQQPLTELRKKLPSWAVFATDKSKDVPALLHKTNKVSAISICLDTYCMEPTDSEENALEILGDILSDQGV